MAGEAADLYEGIRQDLIRLHVNWQIYKQLFATNDERYKTMNNTAPAFFQFIQDALVDNAVIAISRLTDSARHASLERLVKALKNQVHHVFFAELEQDVSDLKAKCEDIRVHRDNRVAHMARSDSPPQGPTKLPPITRKMIEGAMADAAGLMNKIIGHFESANQVFEPVVYGDAETLLFFLEKGFEATRPPKQFRNSPS